MLVPHPMAAWLAANGCETTHSTKKSYAKHNAQHATACSINMMLPCADMRSAAITTSRLPRRAGTALSPWYICALWSAHIDERTTQLHQDAVLAMLAKMSAQVVCTDMTSLQCWSHMAAGVDCHSMPDCRGLACVAAWKAGISSRRALPRPTPSGAISHKGQWLPCGQYVQRHNASIQVPVLT
jgi:hypothetical protein